jgi:hypothetical protein
LWSNVDQAKLEALEAAWKRGGRIALDGLAEKDSVFFVQLAVLLFPHAVIESLMPTFGRCWPECFENANTEIVT